MNRQSMMTVILAALALAGGTLCGCPTGGGGGGQWIYAPHLYNYGHEITVQPDGSYFVSGARGDRAFTQNKVLAGYHISASGTLLRYWTIDGLYPYASYIPDPGALMLSSGDVVLAGATDSRFRMDRGAIHLRVARLTPEGDVLWDNTWGQGWEDERIVQNVLEHTNGDIVVSGFQYGCGWTCGPFVARIDPDGNMLWVSEWESEGNSPFANDMVATDDGGVVFVDYFRESGLERDPYLHKVSAEGEDVWHVYYPLERGQGPVAMAALADGGFLVTGDAIRETNGYRYSPFLLRTDAEGNLLWYREEVVPPTTVNADYEVYNLAVDDDGTVAILYNGSAVEYLGSIPLIRDGDFLAQLTPDGDLITQTRLESLYTFGLAATGRGTWLVSGTIAVPGAHPMLLTEIDKNGKILH